MLPKKGLRGKSLKNKKWLFIVNWKQPQNNLAAKTRSQAGSRMMPSQCAGVCGRMGSIGSPEGGLSVCKEEEFDKDSGHHSGEEEGAAEPLEVDRTGAINSWRS